MKSVFASLLQKAFSRGSRGIQEFCATRTEYSSLDTLSGTEMYFLVLEANNSKIQGPGPGGASLLTHFMAGSRQMRGGQALSSKTKPCLQQARSWNNSINSLTLFSRQKNLSLGPSSQHFYLGNNASNICFL